MDEEYTYAQGLKDGFMIYTILSIVMGIISALLWG